MDLAGLMDKHSDLRKIAQENREYQALIEKQMRGEKLTLEENKRKNDLLKIINAKSETNETTSYP